MYTNIINNNKVSFKDIEQEIFRRCCEAARNATTEILKSMDESIAKIRDKSVYRDKGCRKTSIKTVYGEVEYSRHVYICKDENGDNRSVYLLDQELGIDTIGLVSSNLAEKLINAATKVSFRQAAEMVTETTGQSISHGGVWNLVQTIGEKLEKEEEMLVEEFHSDSSKGKKETPILFEEMDGVWLKSQINGGKKGTGLEVKVGTMYEGWKSDTGKRSVLSEKTVYAGIESSEDFHEKWESKVQSIYDPSKIGMRVLNGDGGGWICDEYDSGAIHQLDRFHVIKMIRQNVLREEIRKEMLELLRADKEDELQELSQIYYDTVCANGKDESEEKKSRELKEYLQNHKGKLKNYKSVIKDLPEAPDGIVYKNMGVQENQNCTLITLRMKGKRKRWAAKSANHMVKLLYYRENADLKEAVERYTDIDLWSETVREKLPEPLSAGRTPKVDGKGKNKYYEIMNAHLPITGSSNSQSVKLFKRIIY